MGNFCSISISCDAIFSRCIDCTGRQASYISNLQDNLAALKKAKQKLIEARNDVRTRIIVAEQRQMEPLDQVRGWLFRLQAFETEVDRVIREGSQEVEKLRLGGFCSKNCWSGYKFGKKVAKKLEDVATLTTESYFEVVAVRKPVAIGDEMPPQPTVGLESTFDKVWSCLQQEQGGIVGLYGMGGVGKTTLLTQINNKFLAIRNDFDFVIWVVVSRNLQLEKIQEDIGKRIGLSDESWKNKSVGEKALEIFKILKEKKFVLLLDDLWNGVSLSELGIPLPGPENASKVIFTTRSVEVCGSMEVQKAFKVDCLTLEKAWELFETKVGKDTLNIHPEIPQLAKIVAKECAGLPLALITIGRAMAYKRSPEEWNYAIQVLRRSSASELLGMDKIYPILKFSYDSLPSDTIRSCLLYCGLFPEDYHIYKRDLIDIWIGEGFIGEYDKEGAQNEGHYIIGILVNACLLEENDNNYVKMHDVIRDMALWITCAIEKERENCIVRAGVGLDEVPKIEEWKDVKRMSLMNNRISSLRPTSWPRNKCHLKTLFLNNNVLISLRGDYDFQNMLSLRVLNLSYNQSLQYFPEGIYSLISLQYLDLSVTTIESLPEELKALVNLKCLNLERTFYLHTIPRRLIASLSMLQVLRMFNCGYLSQASKNSVLFGGCELLVEELFCLEYLDVLSITLKSFDALQKFLSSNKLKSCTESLCLQGFDDSKSLSVSSLTHMEHLDTLHILKCTDLEELKIKGPGDIQELREAHGFRSLHIVKIKSCPKLKELTWLIIAPNLKIIWISDCMDIEELIGVEKFGEVSYMIENLNIFKNIETLRLEDLPNLKNIYWDALPFRRLKEMIVRRCPNLKRLPLDSDSVKERKIVIKGEEDWWKELQWEDHATKDAFLPCFISH